MPSVYFARVGDYVKIGFASNPQQRVKSLLNMGGPVAPDDIDRTQPVELVLVLPFCRMRDERNLHLLFARHWTGVGEWFHWTPEFRFQMSAMRFVTEDERRKHLRAARRDLGIVGGAHVKQSRWGKPTPALLADLNAGGAA